MAFNKIRFYNFRNLENTEILINEKEVFLIGDNGQGKSNFIEGIYLSCFGSSFSTSIHNRLITHNTDTGIIKASFKDQDDIDKEVTLKLTRNKKKGNFCKFKKT